MDKGTVIISCVSQVLFYNRLGHSVGTKSKDEEKFSMEAQVNPFQSWQNHTFDCSLHISNELLGKHQCDCNFEMWREQSKVWFCQDFN